MSKNKISIVVPCYNEEEMIPLFLKEIKKQEKKMPDVQFEIIFINDGSKDTTLSVLKRAHSKNSTVHYISFSRNFGKEAALYAGLEHSTGHYVVVMDVDLQDPPELLGEMYDLITEGEYDCIGTRRVTRKGEPPIRSYFAKQFYSLINRISDTEIVDGARDYRMMTRQMVEAMLNVSEYNRFSKGIFSWVGFNTKFLEYENKERMAGKTTWSFWSLFKYSVDGIVAFSDVPLSIASMIGMLSFLASIFMALFFFIRTIFWGNSTSGWTSIVVVLLGLGGLILLCLGIVGKYVGKIYLEVKNRPIYIIKEKT
ncbi:glycosyltransferase family 2 protein [Marinilactibacillus psychrotolerans]|uniref:Glycosyltransferase family 2 protein n=1 Tax=Marinilactibacillus psychrotolerans TaxID=191770 RepID=A0A5R9C0R0_9LACT|nr:glycosyltransferase family 2 protein [Marinilactibacillus psychrotolerans]TLQ06275.1 glycosyltransferase family 2 protein [Marinilactibacillus psychrotolerans]